jgi:hypothetical protein
MQRDSFTIFAYTRSHKSAYAPSTLAADVERLLDPTYAYAPASPPSSPPSSPRPQPRAYVDSTGELHDPDYRDFPALPHARRGGAQKRRRASSPIRPGRPSWERSGGYASELEDDDDAPDADGSALGLFVTPTRPRSGSASTNGTLAPPEPINFYHRPSFEEDIVFEDAEDASEHAPAATTAGKEAFDDDGRPA